MTDLNKVFLQLLKSRSRQWSMSLEDVALSTGQDEIHNRLLIYPEVGKALAKGRWGSALEHCKQCWALGGQFEAIRLNRFIATRDRGAAAVRALIDESHTAPVRAIDGFVDTAVSLAYTVSSQGTADRAGAALLASVLLTSAAPAQFVDFRRNRWAEFAKRLKYPRPAAAVSYGEWLVWAGKFAATVAETPTFARFWPSAEPLWVVAGFCWRVLRGEPTDQALTDPVEFAAFAEGHKKWRSHLLRERNQAVVRFAKERRRGVDPDLRCEVCRLSFARQYGNRGEGFIEAHHRIPLASLRSGTITRVDDIALVCANCHRMLHREPSITVEGLRRHYARRAT